MPSDAPPKPPWSESDRYVPRVVVQPLQRLLQHEAAGGIVMLVAAVLAIAWANSPWSESYSDLWNTPLVVELGDVLHLDHLSLRAWVNDALMTGFFLLVGLEIKREIVHGELRDVRSVALPALAACGGMVVPAVFYAAFNAGGPGADGWAIPMATDIAFAVGVVTLAGSRVPLAAKLFLLTLAVVDDVGAIVVIAIFYTDSMSWGWLAAALVGLLVVLALRRGDVQSLAPYLMVGAFIWLALLESGFHATLAGVALGLLTPASPLHPPNAFPHRTRTLLDGGDHHLGAVVRLARYSTSPLERIERALSPWVAFGIVPVFALANAGVSLSGDAVGGLLRDRVTVGVIVGLVAGKTLGIFAATALTVRVGLARLPSGTGWAHVFGLAATAGIGFTVALFVTELSFEDQLLTDAAKVGILAASVVAGTVGYFILRRLAPRPTAMAVAPIAAPAEERVRSAV